MFGVFRVFWVNDILEGQKGDQGGGPKKANIFGGVKFRHLGPFFGQKSASNS